MAKKQSIASYRSKLQIAALFLIGFTGVEGKCVVLLFQNFIAIIRYSGSIRKTYMVAIVRKRVFAINSY